MTAGKLVVRVDRADCIMSDLEIPTKKPEDEYCCAARIEDFTLYTETRPASSLAWNNEELTFHLPPRADPSTPRTITMTLYRFQGNEDQKEVVGVGSVGLDHCTDQSHQDKWQNVAVQLVDRRGRHCGSIHLSFRLFSSRTSAKERDELGREVINRHLVDKEPKEQAKELNARSPQHSPRRRLLPTSPTATATGNHLQNA